MGGNMEVNHLLTHDSEPFDITPIYEGIKITRMPRQDKGEDVMIISYDKGFRNKRSVLLVGHRCSSDLYIDSEFRGSEADILYKLLKKEICIGDLMK